MLASPRPLMLVLALVGGCGGGILSESNETQFPAYAATQQPHAQIVYGDAIQPGTQLQIQLDQPGGIDLARTGQRFDATVVSPLVAPGGEVVVPRGARVGGTVGQLEAGSRLHFEQLRVGSAVQPIRARVIATQGTGARTTVTLEIETAILLSALRGSGSFEPGGAFGGGPNLP